MATRDATFKLQGAKALMDSLDKLKESTQRKIVRPAANKAWTPVNKKMKQDYKAVSKIISKSIGKKQQLIKRKGVIITLSGPRVHFEDHNTGHKPENTVHLIEYGTTRHDISVKSKQVLSNENDGRPGASEIFGRAVTHPGTPPNPIMRNAFRATKGEAVRILERDVGKNLEKEAQRLAKKKGRK